MDRPISAYKGDQPYVLVSYSHKESSIVYPELNWLTENGFSVWWDEGIEAGTEWTDELANAIENADLFLFMVTPESVKSQHCRNEVLLAINHEIPVISLHLVKTELPGGLELTISSRQAIHKYELPDAKPLTFHGVSGRQWVVQERRAASDADGGAVGSPARCAGHSCFTKFDKPHAAANRF